MKRAANAIALASKPTSCLPLALRLTDELIGFISDPKCFVAEVAFLRLAAAVGRPA